MRQSLSQNKNLSSTQKQKASSQKDFTSHCGNHTNLALRSLSSISKKASDSKRTFPSESTDTLFHDQPPVTNSEDQSSSSLVHHHNYSDFLQQKVIDE